MAELSVTTEQLPGSQVGLTIEVPSETVDSAFDRVLQRLSQRAKIEGFRPGRAPRALVEARVGPAALREEVIDALVPEVLSQALIEQSIDAIDRPRVEVVELERGRPARLSARVSVMPEIVLPDLANLSVTRPETRVDEEMIDRRVLELRQRLAEIEPVEREVRPGDLMVADLDVEVDGKPVELESRKAIEVEVSEDGMTPEVMAAVQGRHAGEVAEAEHALPDDHPDAELAGKTARIKVTIHGVKEKRVPELTDEVAVQLSDGKQQTAPDFRAAVATDLREQAARLDELAFEQAVVKAVVDGSKLEVPASLVEKEVAVEAEDLERRLQTQGLRLDRYLAYNQVTAEEWVERARPDAEARIKVDLVLNEAARKEGIEPDAAEVEAYMRDLAERDSELATRIDELAKSEAGRDFFRRRLVRSRLLETLVKRAGGDAGQEPAKTESEAPPVPAEAAVPPSQTPHNEGE
jgi:trigger factor